MALIAPAWRQVNPSFVEPELLTQINQASGAFHLLAEGKPRVKLGEGDLAVYIRTASLRTRIAAGQAAYNSLPSCDIVLGVTATASYLLRVGAEFDHHDQAAAAGYNVALPEAHRLAMRQAHAQILRDSLLYGMNPVVGEGMLNAAGATSVTLPPDTFGDTTNSTYDNGQMSLFLLTQWQAIKTRTNQLGIGRTVVICGPQRILGYWELVGIVQLVQFQREGAGTATTSGTFKIIAAENGDTVIWAYDDTLQGKGAGGADAVVMSMPEVSQPATGFPNTNEFGKLPNGMYVNTVMYNDMAAPREIVAPLARGTIDLTTELRTTSGWPVRPEATTIISLFP
jgi:hypothetical protein